MSAIGAVPDAAATPSFVRSFFQHGAIYALGGVLSQGISFVLFPFFAHVFAPHDYGIIDLIALSMTLVNLTLALEISQGLVRHFVDSTDLAERRGYASTALIFSAAVYTAALVAALIAIRPLSALLLGDSGESGVMTIGVVAIWFGAMLSLTQDLLRWQLRPGAFASVSVVTAITTTCTSAVLVLGFGAGVGGAITGQLVGLIVSTLIAFRLSSHLFRLQFDWAKLRQMLAYSVPLVPASAGVFLNAYADRVAIRSRLTISDLGVYGVGARLSMIVSLTLIGFQGALMPLTLSQHEDPATRTAVARIFRLFCAVALAVFLCVSLFADELLRILTRPAYYDAADVVPWLIAAAFFGGMTIFAPGIFIAKRTRTLAAVSVATGALNIGLAFGLAGPMGIRGPAIAFLAASATGFTVLVALSQRLYRVPHKWLPLVASACGVTVIVAFGRWELGGATAPRDVLAKAGLVVVGLSLPLALLLTSQERRELVRLPRRGAALARSFLRTIRRPRRETLV
jgi:O-antigen/teichoic acid export membrane protein